jgi:hypothetical protein
VDNELSKFSFLEFSNHLWHCYIRKNRNIVTVSCYDRENNIVKNNVDNLWICERMCLLQKEVSRYAILAKVLFMAMKRWKAFLFKLSAVGFIVAALLTG